MQGDTPVEELRRFSADRQIADKGTTAERLLMVVSNRHCNRKQKNIFMPKEQYSNIMEIKRTLSLLAVFLLLCQPLSVFGVSLGDAPSPDVQEAGIISETKYYVQGEYPVCSDGKISEPCKCGEKAYNAGFCCYHPNANSGIWFEPSYEDILPNGCPTGNFYFVDQNHPNASDDNPGTEELPWKTITKACQTAQAGDTVLVRAGNYVVTGTGLYYLPALTPSHSGTADSPITFKAYPGERVTISGTGKGPVIGSYKKDHIIWDGFTLYEGEVDSGMALIAIWEAKDCIVQNCKVINKIMDWDGWGHAGIRLKGSEGITIRNCIFHGIAGDDQTVGYLSYWCKNITIENCEFYNYNHGIHVKGDNYAFNIRRNIIHDCVSNGVFLNERQTIKDDGYHPVHPDWYVGSDVYTYIYQNIFYNMPVAVRTNSDDQEPYQDWKDTWIWNNVFYNVKMATTVKSVPNFQVWNNIFWLIGENIWILYGIKANVNVPDNKPVYSDYNLIWPAGTGEKWIYNKPENPKTYFSLLAWQNGENLDLHSFVSDPLFVNPEANDFHLQPSSPCLNAGIDRQDYDNDGNTTEPINMGAYITGNETIGLIDLSQYVVEEYPTCSQGKITSPCQCGNQIYNAGFCCYHPNANSGIWFEPSYEDILSNGCPTGNFYFVDQNHSNASDENPGTEELPWKTLKKACNTVVAGDTVIVKAGRYFEPNPETATWYRVLNVANSGTSDNPIIFKSHPLHAAVVVSNGWPAWAIYQREYIIVDGFKIEGMFRFQSCNHCTIRNCDISVGWYPEGDPSMNYALMICGCRNCVIENNYIHDIADSGNHGDNTRCVMIFGDSTNNIFQNNLADAAPGYVYAAFGHKGGGTHNNIWRYNIAKNALVGYYGKGSTDGTLYADDNVYYQNIAINCGIAFKVNHNCRGWQIYNNIAYKCRRFLDAWQESNQNYSVWNNIAVLTDNGNWELPQTCYYLADPLPENFFAYSDYNNFRGTSICIHHYDTYATTLNDWQQKTPFDDHSISTDPLFTNPTSHNFHLQPSSPCLNAGIDRQDYDNDGNTTEPINMGAYITGNETIGLIDLSQYIVEESQPTCASQNGVCCNENQICQNGTFISSSDCGNLCCTGECVSPQLPGDLNDDGHVNVQDIQLNVNVILEIENRPDIIARADVNRDGSVNVLDVQKIVNAVLNA